MCIGAEDFLSCYFECKYEIMSQHSIRIGIRSILARDMRSVYCSIVAYRLVMAGCAQTYEAVARGSYNVCGVIPASICILVDSLAWSRTYRFWMPIFLGYFEECTGMKAVAICMTAPV